jgi:hypothetical protein
VLDTQYVLRFEITNDRSIPRVVPAMLDGDRPRAVWP